MGERQLCKLDVVGSIPITSTTFLFGQLAQLVRASRLHREGREFESLIAHHKNFPASK